MQVLVSRAGLTLNPGQMADLVLAWRQVVGLMGLIPRDRPLADDQALVFRLPPPANSAKPAQATRGAAKPGQITRRTDEPAPAQRVAAKPAPAKLVAAQRITTKLAPAKRVAAKPARAKPGPAKPGPTERVAAKPDATSRARPPTPHAGKPPARIAVRRRR